jgi:hypothetical protein
MGAVIAPFIFSSAFLATEVGATTVGAIVAGVINVGLSVGVGLIAQALAPKPPGPQDVQGVLRQSVNSRMRHYGRVKVGGPMAFAETSDGTFYQIVLHGDGPIDGYDAIYIDNRLVEVDNHGGVTTSPFSPSNQVIVDRIGTGTQTAIDALIATFPSIWTERHQLKRIAYTFMSADSVDPEDVQKVYPNRLPVINRVLRGAPCFDPRDGETKFGRNAALHLRDYLTHRDGMNLPAGWIDDDTFKRAANVAGQNLVTKAGEHIDRYAIGLSYAFNEEPKNVIGRFLTATDGRLYLTGEGKIGFSAGIWAEPTVTLTDAHIIDYELTDGSGPFRQSNEIIVQYTQVEAGYVEATSDPWRDEASIAALGDVLSKTVTAYEIQHHNHARRIAKLTQIRNNPRWTGTIVTNLAGLAAWDQRWIGVTLSDLDIDEPFEIMGPPSFDAATMTLTFQVQSFPADAYDFDPATEEGTEPTVPDDVEDADIPKPTGVVTDKEFRKVGDVDGNDVKVYVGTMTWGAATRKGLYAEAQYSLNGGFDWLGMTVASKGRKAETQPLPRPSTVKFQVRWRANGGGHSDWADGATVNIPA